MLWDFEVAIRALKKYKLSYPSFALARTESQAKQAFAKLKAPIAVKALSKTVSHKTEANAVVLNIRTEKDALKAFHDVQDSVKKFDKKAKVDAVLFQEMVKGRELFIGGKKDETFGPTLLFGVGGTSVELYGDVSIRICPVSLQDAQEMMESVKGKKLLEEWRGAKALDKGALAQLLVNSSNFMLGERVKEFDFNPVIANANGFWIADPRIIK
ncbi:MAG: acetate--CoA ligase family protein [Candidatus Diapherotrites archaeon]